MPATDLTKAVDLFLHAEGTGPKRQKRPVYVDFMPPCNSACPAGENIQAWMAHAQAGNYFEAFQVIMEDNPFPATMGRVCVKPCETGCNRNHIDTTVNIHAVERHIGDEAIRNHWQVQGAAAPTGKRILVIGAGPSGLSAAYHLARMGHTVEVYEASGHAGGLLWSGVPEYRLPKELLEAEFERIARMGVSIRVNYRVKDLLGEKESGKFDAVYLSIGAQMISPENYVHDRSVYTVDAFSFFEEAKANPAPYTNKKVVVYGGGKLALYISRMIKRFGSEVSVYFPGDKKMMPAYDYETEDALAEGVDVSLLKGIAKVEQNLITFDRLVVEKGKAVASGQQETVQADVLILANRQQTASSFLRQLPGLVINQDGTLPVDAQRMTACPGIFAGGDMLPGENRSSTIAIGQGKKAARYINAFVLAQTYQKPEKHPTAGYRKLHMWYKTEAPQQEQGRLDPLVAVKSFEEVIGGLSEPEARFEAQRCLSCGNCFECDGCFGACPEDAILKLGKGNRYSFNYNACTGCAVCYEQCPCHAIEMIPEPVNTSTDVK